MNVTLVPTEIEYPDSDGMPMADNTLQADEIIRLKSNFDILFADRPDVFVAADLLWYPVEGYPEIRVAPDVMVAFGRPKGYRGSYRQWQESDMPFEVVFEILSPGNRDDAMRRKFEFYERYGVLEYYLYDPEEFRLSLWRRDAAREALRPVNTMEWTSPLLGVRFDAPDGLEWILHYPDGERFLMPVELHRKRQRMEAERDAAQGLTIIVQRQRDAAQQQRDVFREERDAAEQKMNAAQQERDLAQQRAARLALKLRELGLDPDTMTE